MTPLPAPSRTSPVITGLLAVGARLDNLVRVVFRKVVAVLVAGTQAAREKENEIMIMKLSGLHKG